MPWLKSLVNHLNDEWLDNVNIMQPTFRTYATRHFYGITHQCIGSDSQLVLIYVNPQRSPLTIYTILNNIPIKSQSRQSHLLEDYWFPHLLHRQRFAFVSNTFSRGLSLYANYPFKAKWQSCQPISYGQVVGFLRRGYRKLLECPRCHLKSKVLGSWKHSSFPGAMWASIDITMAS